MEMPLLPGSLRPLWRGLKKNAPKIWGKKLIFFFFFFEVYIYIYIEDIEEKKIVLHFSSLAPLLP